MIFLLSILASQTSFSFHICTPSNTDHAPPCIAIPKRANMRDAQTRNAGRSPPKQNNYSATSLLNPRSMNQRPADGDSSFPDAFQSSMSTLSNMIDMQAKSSSPPDSNVPSLSNDSIRSSSSSSPVLPSQNPIAYAEDDEKGNLKPTFSRSHLPPRMSRHPTTQYQPAQLLDPKRAGPSSRMPVSDSGATIKDTSSSTAPQFVFSTSNQSSPDDSDEDSSGADGMKSMIEGMHNVSERQNRPSKRLKIEDDHEPSAKFNGSKGGYIADYIKEKRKEPLDMPSNDIKDMGADNPSGEVSNGAENTGSSVEGSVDANSRATAQQTAEVVDLTAGELALTGIRPCSFPLDDDHDDHDDTTKSHFEAEDRRLVCYGTVQDAKVMAFQVPSPNATSNALGKQWWPRIKCTLSRYPGRNHIVIRVKDAAGKDFGNVDSRTSLGLAPLMDTPIMKLQTKAYLDARRREKSEFPGAGSSDKLKMTLNLYGPRRNAEAIGRALSQKQIYLREPTQVTQGIPYFNPQAAVRSYQPRATFLSRQSNFSVRSAEEMRSDVLGVFESITKSDTLPELEPDARITTSLLGHQKQALHFMVDREREVECNEDEEGNSSNPLWRFTVKGNGRKVWYNIITGHEEQEPPKSTLGGILADMMGLGKTLSVLSTVTYTLEDAAQWVDTSDTSSTKDGVKLRNVKTTLLVCPLSVIANWEEQIATHTRPGSLQSYVFHGSNRNADPEFLANLDIMITTYSIVSNELNRHRRKGAQPSPFTTLNFFRIVLDEAHIIREQSRLQSRAICELYGSRRWALTGTPVQNRLDDLGALIKFIRLKPFDESNIFSQFILAPFKIADPDIIPRLRLMVDSVTLRRTKEKINIPARHDEIVTLVFSKEEQELYDWFAKDAGNRLRAMSNNRQARLAGKGYHHVLRAILCLRLISAHGKELLGEDDLKLVEGASSNNAIDVDEEDEKPAINDRQAYEMLSLYQETNTDMCTQCASKLTPVDLDDEKDQKMGMMLPCYQVFCNDCSTKVKQDIESRSHDNRFKCPFCNEIVKLAFFILTRQGLEKTEEAREKARGNPRQAKIIGRYQGPHTKTQMLIDCLKKSRHESLAKQDEMPIKSVVFSAWTTHLDLIQIALEDNNLQYVRLDGKMSRAHRKQSLTKFREDPEVTVILVTIGAGGLGLNLTAASKVYVMEPQYNPAAEAQAVDRVHRLGQEREVTCVRFIMHHSIEERLLELQKKKQKLAELSMNRGKIDREEARRQKLEELRTLFK